MIFLARLAKFFISTIVLLLVLSLCGFFVLPKRITRYNVDMYGFAPVVQSSYGSVQQFGAFLSPIAKVIGVGTVEQESEEGDITSGLLEAQEYTLEYYGISCPARMDYGILNKILEPSVVSQYEARKSKFFDALTMLRDDGIISSTLYEHYVSEFEKTFEGDNSWYWFYVSDIQVRDAF